MSSRAPPAADAALLSSGASHGPHHAARWLSWLVGVAAVAAVAVAATHLSEERAFARLVEQASPWWLLVAVGLQIATYLAQGEIFRDVARAGNTPLPLGLTLRLSLAKLFVDQALPSGGVSGTALLSRALQQAGVARSVVMASVVVSLVSFYLANVVALVFALLISAGEGHASGIVLAASGLFVAFAIALTLLLFLIAGREGRFARAARIPLIGPLVSSVRAADPTLSRDRRLLARASLWQLAIVLLDGATLWFIIRALGHTAPPGAVFASFMIATVAKTVSPMPGGLGFFEAASVVTLEMVSVPLAVALSATLLFRGLTFWLPMVPGLLVARGLRGGRPASAPAPGAWWSLPPDQLAARIGAGPGGLSAAEAARRLAAVGPNEIRAQRALSRLSVFGRQLRNPLLLLLFFAAGASIATGQWVDATIVLAIALATVVIGASREYRAQAAVDQLRARVRASATVLRDGRPMSVPVRELVPGDVVLLSAGSLVPADAALLEATDFYVNQAVLTGESFPVMKEVGPSEAGAGLGERLGSVFLGTTARSGTARALVVETGAATRFGAIAHRLTLRPPVTEFDRGIHRFGYLLTTAMLVMVLLVFAANVFLGRPPVETLLFSIALAVGLSPELLPAILSVNLARGAQMMAQRGVLVRRLPAIENLGSMDILCTDKTGTLTEGVVELDGAFDTSGARSTEVLELGAINAALQSGLANPLDEAIVAAHRPALAGVDKLGEIPYDFVRKRLSVVVRAGGRVRLITKGAFGPVLAACTSAAGGGPLDDARRAELEERFRAWSREGTRVLAVAARDIAASPGYRRDDERELELVGFLAFRDRPKEGVGEALRDLAQLGVSVKLITGDARLVAEHVARSVGMSAARILDGKQLERLHDEALWHAAEKTDLFVEVDPNQKERIILALKKMGHTVGFLGDGINDAPAMHAADTSLSVDKAVDVAREAADFVLLERDLDVIRRGVEEGRRTFANTLKYILTTTSANLGNMVSMALASLFLPFLPLLAGQVLLNNFLSDIPAIGMADDAVDPELVDRPRRWSMRFIGRFMIEFGVTSSLFDVLTFAALLGLFHAGPELFRTGWFVESLLTELVIALIVRTNRPFYRSRPGRLLLGSTLLLIPLTLAIPFLPGAHLLGFVPAPARLLAAILVITLLYVLATELLKRWFYRRAAVVY